MRLVLAWQIDGQWRFNADLVTEVEVRFVPDGAETRVELEHRNHNRFVDQAYQVRAALKALEGWCGLLERFAAETVRGA